jgi:DNA polymerase I
MREQHAQLDNVVAEQLAEVGRIVQRDFGVAGFNPSSPSQVKKLLKVKDVGADALRAIKSQHAKLARLIATYRETRRLCSEYEEYLSYGDARTGRVYPRWSNHSTRTGRLAVQAPNMQNLSIGGVDHFVAPRHFVVGADADHVLLAADYSQIELRILVHELGRHYPSYRTEKLYRLFCDDRDSDIFKELATDVRVERGRIKSVVYALLYGAGPALLAAKLGCSEKKASDECRHIINKCLKPYTDYAKKLRESAKQSGYIKTLFGLRRQLNKSEVYTKAVNTVMQGTAAHIIKLAMLAISNGLENSNLNAHLYLQVHDELVFSVHRKDVAKLAALVRHHMGSPSVRPPHMAIKLPVTFQLGNNFGEMVNYQL